MAINWSEVSDDDVKAMPPEVANKVKAQFPEKKEEEAPATVAQLKDAFPGDAVLRGKALDSGWTLSQARASLDADRQAQIAALTTENGTLKAAVQNKVDTTVKVLGTLGQNGIAPNGVAPVGEAPAEVTANAYETAIRAEMQTANVDRFKATANVNQKQPALRLAWLESQVATSGKRAK